MFKIYKDTYHDPVHVQMYCMVISSDNIVFYSFLDFVFIAFAIYGTVLISYCNRSGLKSHIRNSEWITLGIYD